MPFDQPGGKGTGPWKQMDQPLVGRGHGMLFTSADGQLTLSLHDKNTTQHSNYVFMPAKLEKDKWRFSRIL